MRLYTPGTFGNNPCPVEWVDCFARLRRNLYASPVSPQRRRNGRQALSQFYIIAGLPDTVARAEGLQRGSVRGTYLHGWFEAPEVRRRVAAWAGIVGHSAHPVPWAEKRRAVYTGMAEHLAAHADLGPVRRYLGL